MMLLKIFKKIIYSLIYIYNKFLFGNLGKHSVIKHPLLITNKKHIFIGNDVQIREFSRIEPIVKWNTKYYNPVIMIGDGTMIEQGFHLTCARKVDIGKHVCITPYCSITDINHQYENINTWIIEQDLNVSEVKIGDGSFIGTGAKIMPGVHIGKHCVVGANAVVTHDVADFCVVAGAPATVIKKYNIITKKWEVSNKKNNYE